MDAPRHPTLAPPSGRELVVMLHDARRRLLALVADLSDEQLRVPLLAILNPPLWEIGHVAWFQEKWNLRELGGDPALRADADRLFDSSAVPHDSRWELLLPRRDEVLAYLAEVLARTCARLQDDDLGEGIEERRRYFAQLALFHEDMHAEALAYTRQTLGWPRPAIEALAPEAAGGPTADERDAGPLPGDVEVPGGTFLLGSPPSDCFIFDNEKWAHPVTVAPFRIARAAVTQAEFAEFVEARGYEREELWSEEGWRWRREADAHHPVAWERGSGGRWLRRSFDRRVPLEEHRPVLHVNWHEADAWCRWRGRRLPTEAEWELAASGAPDRDATQGMGGLRFERRLFPWGDEPPTARCAHLGARSLDTIDVGALPASDSAFGCRQMIGNVWEWTASDFEPYPGFSPDPYRDYSAPWFGWHKVLRGGCLVTQPRLIRNAWRNFYTPDRRDVWAGFRTCATSPLARR